MRRFFLRKQKKRSATERAKDARKFILRSFMRRRKLLATEGYAAMNWRKNMFYTYILRSLSQPEQRYIGSTSDLKSRLAKHNAGEVPHTTKFKPWKIEAYFAFETKEKAVAFEAYLKNGSGYSFAKRHF